MLELPLLTKELAVQAGASAPLWLIAFFSFLVALTGAMSPGPLLTYTIIKSIQSGSRGYLMGLWIIIGHAILELAIVLVLLLGFSFVLTNNLVVRGIGLAGGLLLVYFGSSIVRDVYRKRISTDFLEGKGIAESRGETARPLRDNPIIGGIAVSMSNPYWWVWWATIGFAFMAQFDITLRAWPKLAAFYLGHEAGDLIWYLMVSSFAFMGRKSLSRPAYYGVLAVCAIFMIGFGIYLGISPFII